MDAITDFAALRTEAAGCRRRALWANATQTVFGEGGVEARLLFVGEQPGDREDIAGRPFVGPPAPFSTARWRKRAWIASASMSPMR